VAVPDSLFAVFGSCFGLGDDASYYIYLIVFTVVVAPFCFGNFQKTKYLQLGTMGFRIGSLLL